MFVASSCSFLRALILRLTGGGSAWMAKQKQKQRNYILARVKLKDKYLNILKQL